MAVGAYIQVIPRVPHCETGVGGDRAHCPCAKKRQRSTHLSSDREERPEHDEPEGTLEEYVKPRLLTLGTWGDVTGGPNVGSDPDGLGPGAS